MAGSVHGSPLRGVMMQDIQSTPAKEHRVLLSYDCKEKKLTLQKSWSFKQLKNEIRKRFPKLKADFRLIDVDYAEMDEQNFTILQNLSPRQTWLLVQNTVSACRAHNFCLVENEEKRHPIFSKRIELAFQRWVREESADESDLILKKPSYELLKYDVHPNALTQSGNYHFSSCYQAFCEFIDNSVQATKQNHGERTIKLHVYEDWRISCIFDNGAGMTAEGMKAFLSYFLSQEDRGLERGVSETFAYLDSNISKFGVGATQAGFYLGDTIKVVSKKANSQFVTEVSISKYKLHQRASNNVPVFEDYKCIRTAGDMSTLEESELCLKELVAQEKSHPNFTYVVISEMHRKHLDYITNNDGKSLARNLAHVYHYYLHGIHGSKRKLEFDRMSLSSFEESPEPSISISIVIHDKNDKEEETFLKDVNDDLQSLYQQHAQAVFPFCLELNNSNMKHFVQGCLLYFPNVLGEETLPTSKVQDGDNNQRDPCFECFWQGRLAPLSFVNKLEFCSKPDNRSRKQRDVLPDACFNRIRGLLFFNRNTPVSNNKLKILLDTNLDLSEALSGASTSRRNLAQSFRQWLEVCHRNFDKEIFFLEALTINQPNNGDLFCKKVKVISDKANVVYNSGDIVRIDTRPVAYGKVMYFIQKGKINEPGTVIYIKVPEEVYGDSPDERPVMRITGKPEKAALAKYISTEMLQMPKSIRVFQGNDRTNTVADILQFRTGEAMKTKTNFWVAVYNGEKPPKCIVVLQHRKLLVKFDITDRNPLVNGSPVSDYYGFKPFYLDRVGVYTVTFSVMIGNTPSGLEKKIEIHMKPNIAEIVNLLSNTPDVIPLGEKCVGFSLSFHDIYENPTTIFKNNLDHVKLTCTAKHLIIEGVEESYKPNEDGILHVTGLSVVAAPDHQVSLINDYEFWIVAEGIGDVMFAVRLMTGPPSKVKITKLPSFEFNNFENFPSVDAKVIDKFDQPCRISDKEMKLALLCDAFVTPILTSTVTNGKAKFPTAPIKVDNLVQPLYHDVRISLVVPKMLKHKITVSRIVKELFKFEIKVSPSNNCKRIVILKDGGESGEVTAVAGSIVENLRIAGYSEMGKLLSDDDFLSQDVRISTTWAEVNANKLPSLPNCPVSNIIQMNVHNIQCLHKYNGFEIRNEAKLKISVVPGKAMKWSFQPVSEVVVNDKKNDLSNALKIICLDKCHNQTMPTADVVPIVTVEHVQKDSHVQFAGQVILEKNTYVFTADSILSGLAGQVRLCVHDQHGVLTKDSVSVQLDSGLPAKITATCKAFENKGPIPLIRMYSKCAIVHPIMCCITDRHGNQTQIKRLVKIEWSHASMGKSSTRMTRPDGSVSFPANSLRCNEVVRNAKLKISVEDKNISPFLIDVHVLQCNRITKITPMCDEEKTFNSCSNFPVVKVSYETEDGVLVPNFLDCLTLEFKKSSGIYTSLTNVYPLLQRTMADNMAVFTPKPDFVFEEAGLWIISCQYTEAREELKQLGNLITTGSHEITVHPGDAVKFCISIPDDVTLVASSTAPVKDRTLIPYIHRSALRRNSMVQSSSVFLSAVDEHGNTCTTFNANISVFVEAVHSSILDPDCIIPALEESCSHLKMKNGCVELSPIILKNNVGNKIGSYYLVFSDQVCKPCRVQFLFSTNEELDKVTQELAPLCDELSSLGSRLKMKREEAKRLRNTEKELFTRVAKTFAVEQPNLQEIDLEISKLRNSSYDFELREQRSRRATKDRNYPPASVRPYIKGLVCELAHVSDEKLCCILSWYAQTKLKVALCETKEQQRRVYDLGCPAYSENLISGFTKKSRGGGSQALNGLLPIDLPRPPPGFQSTINFAVNLLEFTQNNAYLRGTLFYSIFSNTIVLSDLDHAQRYREHLLKMNHRCPAILTMNGDLIAGDGLMDPNRKCPARLVHLRYTFGELPHTQKPECLAQLSDLQNLNELRNAKFNTDIVDKEVRQLEKDLHNRQIALRPRINELEQRLSTIKEKSKEIKKVLSPPTKRKKR